MNKGTFPESIKTLFNNSEKIQAAYKARVEFFDKALADVLKNYDDLLQSYKNNMPDGDTVEELEKWLNVRLWIEFKNRKDGKK